MGISCRTHFLSKKHSPDNSYPQVPCFGGKKRKGKVLRMGSCCNSMMTTGEHKKFVFFFHLDKFTSHTHSAKMWLGNARKTMI